MGYAIAMLVFILISWICVVLHWKGLTARSETIVERMSPYSAGFSRAMTRGAPVLTGCFTMCGGGAVVVELGNVEPGTGALATALYIPLVVAFVLFLTLISVICFNWPKWVVAPRFRGELGMTVAWWRKRRGSAA